MIVLYIILAIAVSILGAVGTVGYLCAPEEFDE